MATIDPLIAQCDQEDEGLFSLHYPLPPPLLDNYTPYLQSSCAAVGVDSTKLEATPSCSSCPPTFTEGSDLLTFLELLEDSESVGWNQIGSAQWDALWGDDDDDELLRECIQPYIEDVLQHDTILLPMQQQQPQLLDAAAAGSPRFSNADPPVADSWKTQKGRPPSSASAKPDHHQALRISTSGQKRARKLLAVAPALSMSQRMHSLHQQRHSVSDEEFNADHDEARPRKSSKNVDYERQRRQKLNATLYTLRALVPNISKMDKASIVSDAIDHVQSLRKQVKDVEDEILALKLWGHALRKNIANGVATLSSSEEQVEQQKILEVDVSMADSSVYQLKILCLNGDGVIGNLTKALDTLQFDIVNANVTTIDDHVLSTIFLEAKKYGLGLTPMQLRDMILKVSLRFGLGIAEN